MSRLKNAYSTCMSCGGKKMKSGGKWIQSAIKKPGSFTAQANKAGMSVPAFRDKVLSNKEAYSSTTVKRANLAKTLAGMRKGEYGMLNSTGAKTTKNLAVKSNKGQGKEMPKMSTVRSKDSYGMRKGAEGMEVSKRDLKAGRKEVMGIESKGLPTNSVNLTTPTPIESPANWYNESVWDKAQAENAVRPAANTPVSSSNPSVKGGSEKVRAYQEMLRSKGYDIVADGAWGPKTQKAYESYIKSKTVASAPKAASVSPSKPAAKTTSTSSSQTWNYTPAQWDAAQRQNAMRPVAGATYGPTRANMTIKPAPAAPVNRAPIAAPGKPVVKSTAPDQLPAWAKRAIAQNNAKKAAPKAPIKFK